MTPPGPACRSGSPIPAWRLPSGRILLRPRPKERAGGWGLERPDSSILDTVLLTGASGFVGRELLWRLARKSSIRVVCLLRAKDDADADARLARVLDQARPEPLS